MARDTSALTDEQWKKIAPLLPNRRPHPRVVQNPCRTVPASRASCGYCAAGPVGKTSPSDIRRPVRAGDAEGIGKNTTSGSRRGEPSLGNAIARANSIGPKPLPMAVLPRQKKGGLCRANQAGQRHEVDGGG
jgi:hypothetical protein